MWTLGLSQIRPCQRSDASANTEHLPVGSRTGAEQMQEQMRMKSTLVTAAAIIAAVHLARDPDISRSYPRLTAVVSESVSLARMILDRVGRS